MKDYIYYEAIKDTSDSIFARQQKECRCTLHFHRAFEVAYILSGASNYIIEDNGFVAEEGDIVFCHSYYRHRSLDTQPNVKYVIAVPDNLTRDISFFFEKSTLQPCLSDKEFNRSLLPYFENLVKDGENMSRMLMKGYANVIFGSLSQHYSLSPTMQRHKSVSHVADILDYIDAHCSESISLESIASAFGYNKAYFSRLFNRYIGMSLSSYINMTRYSKFRKMRKENPEANVTEMAYECGFSSMTTFYRVHALYAKHFF